MKGRFENISGKNRYQICGFCGQCLKPAIQEGVGL